MNCAFIYSDVFSVNLCDCRQFAHLIRRIRFFGHKNAYKWSSLGWWKEARANIHYWNCWKNWTVPTWKYRISFERGLLHTRNMQWFLDCFLILSSDYVIKNRKVFVQTICLFWIHMFTAKHAFSASLFFYLLALQDEHLKFVGMYMRRLFGSRNCMAHGFTNS